MSGMQAAAAFLGDTLLPLLDCGGQRENIFKSSNSTWYPAFCTLTENLGETNSDHKDFKGIWSNIAEK